MAAFFFVVGLEIKRELLVGELASLRQASLPIAAAVGGMLVPAGIYLVFNANGPGERGWGIPMATDIAFALGVLALLGDRVPPPLRVFLAALAIVDDIGAVIVIAVFYTAEISWICLGLGGTFFLVLVCANVLGVRRPLVYAVLGLALWAAFLKSGVHATVAGVLLAATIPGRQRINEREFLDESENLLRQFRSAADNEQGEGILTSETQQAAVQTLEEVCEKVETPMQRFEHSLLPWVKNFIMPVFALSNAGVAFGGNLISDLHSAVGLGVLSGLVLGKPIGIALFSWLAVRSGMAQLPSAVNWKHVLGVGALGGIGFTMSLFVAGLAFGSTSRLDTAKVGILTASLLAGLAGTVVLWKATRVARSE